MTFDHPWILLALLLPLGWAAWEWRDTARRLALGLKAATFVCIVLALSGPRIVVYQTKVAVAMLADTSASVSPEDLARESAIASQVERGHGRHWTRIIPFARGTRQTTLAEKTKDGWQLRQTAGPAGRGTDLENAIRDGAATLPAGMVPRLLLVSDGNENLGSVARANWQAQQMGVTIDTIAQAGLPKPGLRLQSVTIPGQVFSGERFPIDVAVEAPGAAHARVELTAEGKTIGASEVDLAGGVNHLRLQANINAIGAVALAGKIGSSTLGEARFEDSVTLRSPRVLLVSHDPAASEEHSIRALHANQFEVQQSPTGVPPKLDDFHLLGINNWDMESIPATSKASLEEYVKQGGGLVWIAGEHNVYVDKKGKPEDALERTLPAKLAPPRSPKAPPSY